MIEITDQGELDPKLKKYKRNIEQLATLVKNQQEIILKLQNKIERRNNKVLETQVKSKLSHEIARTFMKSYVPKNDKEAQCTIISKGEIEKYQDEIKQLKVLIEKIYEENKKLRDDKSQEGESIQLKLRIIELEDNIEQIRQESAHLTATHKQQI